MLLKRAVLSLTILAIGSVPAFGVVIPQGDVAVAVGSESVKVFSPTGTLLETLNDGSGTEFTTGMVFDGSDNLYVTNFGAGTISQFGPTGTLLNSSWATASNTPESILVNAAGNFIVGGPGAANLEQFSSSGGSPTATYNVVGGNGTGGTDWADLEADQATVLYDGEGSEILSYNLATHTQNAAFATGLTGTIFEFRIIPSGTFAGDVLVADSSQAILLSSTGAVIKTYTLTGGVNGVDFALNLDPNGTDFWTADSGGDVWEINIATGAIDEHWNSGSSSTFGLVVNGQITAGGPPPPPPTNPIPEPNSLALLGTGLAALVSRFRKVLTA